MKNPHKNQSSNIKSAVSSVLLSSGIEIVRFPEIWLTFPPKLIQAFAAERAVPPPPTIANTEFSMTKPDSKANQTTANPSVLIE